MSAVGGAAKPLFLPYANLVSIRKKLDYVIIRLLGVRVGDTFDTTRNKVYNSSCETYLSQILSFFASENQRG